MNLRATSSLVLLSRSILNRLRHQLVKKAGYGSGSSYRTVSYHLFREKMFSKMFTFPFSHKYSSWIHWNGATVSTKKGHSRVRLHRPQHCFPLSPDLFITVFEIQTDPVFFYRSVSWRIQHKIKEFLYKKKLLLCEYVRHWSLTCAWECIKRLGTIVPGYQDLKQFLAFSRE